MKLSLPVVLLTAVALIALDVYVGSALKLSLAVKNLVLAPITLIIIAVIFKRWLDS